MGTIKDDLKVRKELVESKNHATGRIEIGYELDGHQVMIHESIEILQFY